MELTEMQWKKIFEILDKYRKEPAKTGRPRQNDYQIFKGICWILKTGAKWKELPNDYTASPKSRCWILEECDVYQGSDIATHKGFLIEGAINY